MSFHSWTFLFVVVLLTAPFSALAKDDLVAAYRKEYAFLEAEKQALQQRLKQLDGENETKLRATTSAVDALQSRILSLRSQCDDVEISLRDVEIKTAKAEERADLVVETLSRAADALSRTDSKIVADVEGVEAQVEQIRAAFKGASVLLTTAGAITKQQGSFFLTDGALVEGTVIRVGHIAAYGVNEKGAGALAPAGGNRLKLWQDDAKETATILDAGGAPTTMAVYLFESLVKAVDDKKSQTMLEHIDAGGIISWVIAALGVLALLLVLARVVILSLASSKTEKLLVSVSELIKRGAKGEAMELCKASGGAAARVLRATLRNLDRERQHLEDIVSEAILHEAPVIERFGSTIMVLAAVAPLLGLLGTVTGMISTFDIITEFGTSDPKMLSGGISVALITTELGLIVAIPALLLGNLLTGRANTLLQSMERAALQILNLADEPAVRAMLGR
ncbi:MAG: MotA/TolQ/ExbB proton channel family protein [Myxococcota bacterium]|jgi:biopolymer transport protein ExbB|nr:MotA/TolQ/ExbB proton channel family protein [Myxococcota bacterium]